MPFLIFFYRACCALHISLEAQTRELYYIKNTEVLKAFFGWLSTEMLCKAYVYDKYFYHGSL